MKFFKTEIGLDSRMTIAISLIIFFTYLLVSFVNNLHLNFGFKTLFPAVGLSLIAGCLSRIFLDGIQFEREKLILQKTFRTGHIFTFGAANRTQLKAAFLKMMEDDYKVFHAADLDERTHHDPRKPETYKKFIETQGLKLIKSWQKAFSSVMSYSLPDFEPKLIYILFEAAYKESPWPEEYLMSNLLPEAQRTLDTMKTEPEI